MKKILIIGIGAGDPEYITMQAVRALNEVDVFFMMDKGPAKTKLIELRKEICRRYIRGDNHRFVDATSPDWTRGAEDYFSTVDDLNRDKQALFERLIVEEMADGECGAFLVWGDPTLYDSTIRIIEVIAQSGRHQLDYQVIPGISSIQALAAKHKTTLNRIGQSIEITTGRKMAVCGSGYRYLLGCVCRYAGRNPGVRQAQGCGRRYRTDQDGRPAGEWMDHG
jgi:precorrin-6A synthase